MKLKQFETGKFRLAGILFLLGAIPGITIAQVPVPAGVEGAIGSIISDGNGGAIVNVMGIDVYVPASVFGDSGDPANPGNPSKVTSPTAKLNLASLLDTTVLPGRSQPGFLAVRPSVMAKAPITGMEPQHSWPRTCL